MLSILLNLAVVTSLLGTGLAPATEVPPPSDSQFEMEIFKRLESELLLRHPDLSPQEAAQRLRANFRYVYSNCLKTTGFVIKPSDKLIAARTLDLLESQRELAEILRRIRQSLASRREETTPRAKVKLVRAAGNLGRKIRDMFRRHFLDMSQSSYQMILGRSGEEAYLRFLLQAERINRFLDQELERYFLGQQPGVISVRDYERASVGVLGEALVQLARATEEQMGH